MVKVSEPLLKIIVVPKPAYIFARTALLVPRVFAGSVKLKISVSVVVFWIVTVVAVTYSLIVGTVMVAQLPSPRQNVDAEAPEPPLKCETARLPLTLLAKSTNAQTGAAPAPKVFK